MNKVDAQFAGPSRPGSVTWTIGGVAIVFALVACISAGRAFQSRERAFIALQQARAAVAVRRTEARELPSKEREPDVSLETRQQRSHPWPLALTALESVGMNGITLTTIDYGSSDLAVHLTLEFASHQTLLEYIVTLNEETLDSDWAWRWDFVTSQQPDSARPGTATVVGRWGQVATSR